MHSVQNAKPDIIGENLGCKRESEKHVCLILPLKHCSFGKKHVVLFRFSYFFSICNLLGLVNVI